MAIKRFTSKTKTSKVSNFAIEYLIVGGGGGSKSPTGCCTGSSGAGAGGYIEGTYQAAKGVTYTVVVGGGGSAENGNPSSVFGIVATGGGHGTAYATVYPGSGGSGGGGGFSGATGPDYRPGIGLTGQGNNGGLDASLDPDPGGGGGGGAGAAGSNSASYNGYTGNSPYAGDGGIGKQSSITGTATYYAGGGGASIRDNAAATHPSKTFIRGVGGSGGGGNGSNYTTDNGSNGTANTGGGAGGSFGDANSSTRSGGSGVVILRAAVAAASTTGSPTYTTSDGWHIYKFTGDGSITY